MTPPRFGPGAEFEMIQSLVRRWGPLADGIGDDAAVVRPVRGESTIVSVDSSVENRHFKPEWLSPAEIGYRAVAAALSDLAAMAARPTGVLVALAVPERWLGRLEEIADGIGKAVELSRARIVGGNMSGASELSITTTVLGSAFGPLMRSGARAGDRLYVTGRLGAVRAVLASLERGDAPGPHRDRFARPVPRFDEAHWLAARGATAAIDISDGLVADLSHLAAASGVGVMVRADQVPRSTGVSVEDALQSGEEYELLVTSRFEFDAAEFQRRFGIELTEIGRMRATEPGSVEVAGVEVAALTGHDHFSR